MKEKRVHIKIVERAKCCRVLQSRASETPLGASYEGKRLETKMSRAQNGADCSNRELLRSLEVRVI